MSHPPNWTADGTPDDIPLTSRDVLHWVESGRLSPAAALRHLRRMETAGVPLARAAVPGSDPAAVAAVLKELDALVGLTRIKEVVGEIRAFIEVQKRRRQLNLAADPQTLHMIFKGAPGTGKTTVARIVGKLFQALEVLPKGHLVEAERADLVGEYIGHTAQKTREVIKRAMGGILFVDEAYSLARGGDKDFGKEAIDTLVKALEDRRGEFCLILAGYPREMDGFLASNPGLLSRLPIHLVFADYTPRELIAIARGMLAEREYRLSFEAETGLMQYFTQRERLWHENAGNARLVRNLLERAIRRQAVRLFPRMAAATREDLMLITWDDIEGGL